MKYQKRSTKTHPPRTRIITLFIQVVRQNSRWGGLFSGGGIIGSEAKYLLCNPV